MKKLILVALLLTCFAAYSFKGVANRGAEKCSGAPTPGTVCKGGAIFAGKLGNDRYMTTPGGCTDVPVGLRAGGTDSNSYYASGDFTPASCTGSDTLNKIFSAGLAVYDNPALPNYTTTESIGNGATNTDSNYGSFNTASWVAITSGALGAPFSAALYCDKLSYGGYSDWYLPNRFELHMLVTNRAAIGGFSTSGIYVSSTEYGSRDVWAEEIGSGSQGAGIYFYGDTYTKFTGLLLRCVRRF